MRAGDDVGPVYSILRLPQYMPVFRRRERGLGWKRLIVGFREFVGSCQVGVRQFLVSRTGGCACGDADLIARRSPLLGCDRDQQLASGSSGRPDRRYGGGSRAAACSGPVVRHDIRVSHHHLDALDWDFQLLGGCQRKFCTRSLPFFDLAV